MNYYVEILNKSRSSRCRYIHTYFPIFQHIQIHSGIIRHIKELFRPIHVYSEPCVTQTYLEPWYIWNPYIFRTKSIFRTAVYSTLAYSESWCIQNPVVFIQNPGIFRTLSNIYISAFSKIFYG